MAKVLDKLIGKAQRLPLKSRIKLADRILESLEPADDEGTEGYWNEEIKRRLRLDAKGLEKYFSISSGMAQLKKDLLIY